MTPGARGFTLVEILAASAVVAIGLAGLLAATPVASHGVEDGGRLTVATFLAEERLEQVRGARWSADVDCLGVGVSAAPTIPAGRTCSSGPIALAAGSTTFADEPSLPGHPGHGRTVRIRDCAAAACAGVSSPDLRLVTVTVSHGAGPAALTPAPRSVAISLLVARR